MSPASDRLRSYLVPEESLTAVYAATLSDEAARKTVSIGVTDRRMLCVSDDDTFVSIGYDSICGVRGYSRSRVTLRGNDYRLLLGGGALGVVSGFLGVVALSAGVLLPILSLITVGGLVSAEYLRRSTDDAWRGTLAERATRIDRMFDGTTPVQESLHRVTEYATERQILLFSAVSLTGLSVVVGLLLASSPLLLLPLLLLIGGIALGEYAIDHRDDFDGIETVRRREREVRVSTDDGRVVHIRSDPSAAIDQELSRLAFVDNPESAALVATKT